MTDQQKKAVEEAAKTFVKRYAYTIRPGQDASVKADFRSGAEAVLNNPEKYGLIDANKIDFYAGELNKERIAAWRAEAKAWNIESSSVAKIFCEGIDFAMDTLKGGENDS